MGREFLLNRHPADCRQSNIDHDQVGCLMVDQAQRTDAVAPLRDGEPFQEQRRGRSIPKRWRSWFWLSSRSRLVGDQWRGA